jgi:hypothetical protein
VTQILAQTWAVLGRALKQAHWPGMVGLLLLAAAAALHFFALPPLRDQNNSLQAAVDRADSQRQRRAARRVAGPEQTTPAERFAAPFPDAALREERVAALLKAGKVHGLEVQRTEFRLTRETDLNLMKYSAAQPLRGGYANLRAFIEDAQRTDTALSLDRLRLQKNSVLASTVEAEMSWTFYMRAPPAPAISGSLRTGLLYPRP